MTRTYLHIGARGLGGLALGALLAGCDAGEGEAIEGVGLVVASSGTPESQAFASYRRVEARRPRCPGEVSFGSCSFYDCYLPTEEQIELAEPGVVTIAGGSIDVELTAEARYTQPVVDMPLFAGGEELTFSVEGGDGIDPHEGTLIAPFPITVTEPVLTEPIEIDRIEDFLVSWTRGMNEDCADVHPAPCDEAYVQVSLAIEQVVEEETRRLRLSCTYPIGVPRVILPETLLRSLPAVTDPAEAVLTIGAWTSRRAGVPGWIYDFGATVGESVPVTLR